MYRQNRSTDILPLVVTKIDHFLMHQVFFQDDGDKHWAFCIHFLVMLSCYCNRKLILSIVLARTCIIDVGPSSKSVIGPKRHFRRASMSKKVKVTLTISCVLVCVFLAFCFCFPFRSICLFSSNRRSECLCGYNTVL